MHGRVNQGLAFARRRLFERNGRGRPSPRPSPGGRGGKRKMIRKLATTVTGVVTLLAAAMVGRLGVLDTIRAAPPGPPPPAATPTAAASARIDQLCQKKLDSLGIVPAGVCDDATFIRRVYLDVIGTLPTPAEARKFLASSQPDRRARLIDSLLAREEFADYWSLKWGDLLRIKAEYPVRRSAAVLERDEQSEIEVDDKGDKGRKAENVYSHSRDPFRRRTGSPSQRLSPAAAGHGAGDRRRRDPAVPRACPVRRSSPGQGRRCGLPF